MTVRDRRLARQRALLARDGVRLKRANAGLAEASATRALLRIGLVIDKVGNALLPPILWGRWGTISAALGRTQAHHGGKIPWIFPVARGLTELLDVIDEDHVAEARENEEESWRDA